MTSLALLLLGSLLLSPADTPVPVAPKASVPRLFSGADRCIACHNGLVTPAGENVSIGTSWRPGMMANSSRDPYWQASVRRETLDHPEAQAIEGECSICHMPMTRVQERAGGQAGQLFTHLAPTAAGTPSGLLAADGVSCTVCHQIAADKLGHEDSFTGGFVVDTTLPPGQREIFGPYPVDAGRVRLMLSSSEFKPRQAPRVQTSEVCASCHTLYTHALNAKGEAIARLPEQVPYLEWRHSAYRDTQSCQSCHMPVVASEMPITSVTGQPRTGFSRHSFLGGNFLMIRLFGRYRNELGVAALPGELEAAAVRTIEHLQTGAARLSLTNVGVADGRLGIEAHLENLAGHKLPTAYPSRRAWVHLTVRDRDGKTLFESGAMTKQGSIQGNDNDEDPARFEPHYLEISRPDQAQIYESIMVGPDSAVTTGLLTAVRFIKDNRLLPRGFDKNRAIEDIAVRGAAAEDPDFVESGDVVRYSVDLGGAKGPFVVEAELLYQPIGFRWAQNLLSRKSPEANRFVPYYDSMASASAVALARASAKIE